MEPDLWNSQLFGIYIDIAIIEPKVEDATKNTVTIKTFILSNKSEELSLASYGYIEELLNESNLDHRGDYIIKQELEEFIEKGRSKLSTIFEAVSSYTRGKGNTNIFFTDLACSEYKTFIDTPINLIHIEPSTIDLIELDEINKERTSKLFADKNIPQDYPEDYLNEDGNAFDNGCGILYFDEIESAKLSKSQAEKREYNKIF